VQEVPHCSCDMWLGTGGVPVRAGFAARFGACLAGLCQRWCQALEEHLPVASHLRAAYWLLSLPCLSSRIAHHYMPG